MNFRTFLKNIFIINFNEIYKKILENNSFKYKVLNTNIKIKIFYIYNDK